MSLDINKVGTKISISSCFGSQFKEVEGATAFIDELANDAEEISIAQDEYVFREKDTPEYIYITESGALMLERSTASGSRQVFAFLFTGNLAGLTENVSYSFSAKALTNCVLIRISRKLMQDIFDKYPAVAKRYHDVTSHVLSLMLDQLFIMGQKSAHQRLGHFLLDIEYRLGRGTHRFFLPMSRQDIADYLGMSLETASRGFSKLKKDGLIAIKSNYQITVLDHEKLIAYSD
jgi:CRP/FNR family transcriptional regulator